MVRHGRVLDRADAARLVPFGPRVQTDKVDLGGVQFSAFTFHSDDIEHSNRYLWPELLRSDGRRIAQLVDVEGVRLMLATPIVAQHVLHAQNRLAHAATENMLSISLERNRPYQREKK